MTRYGLEVFLFTLAVFLGLLSVLFSPVKERTRLRLENPRVVVSNPCWEDVKKISSDFTRTRMIYELLKLGGYMSKEGFIVERTSRDSVVLKMRKFGTKYEFVDKNTARIIPYSIVVFVK